MFVPAVEEVITTIAGARRARRRARFCEAGVAAPEMTVTVHVVPAGAFVTPVPSLTLMWQCNVWFVPTAFVAVAGVIWMFASTHVL